jgi:nitrile hydratase beta subunit
LNSIHDVGGMDGFGPVEWEADEPIFHEPWEGRMRALSMLASRKLRVYNTDESRHAIERMHPVYYLGSTYYQIWLLRMEKLLIEKGTLTEAEIEQQMAKITSTPVTSHLQPYRKLVPVIPSTERRKVLSVSSGSAQRDQPTAPKFSPGDVVTVKRMAPLGHTRVPRYVRGKTGVIEEIHGNFILPDLRVQEGIDLYQPVYRVRFRAQEIWGEDASPKDKLLIEMWEDYLESGGIGHGKQ